MTDKQLLDRVIAALTPLTPTDKGGREAWVHGAWGAGKPPATEVEYTGNQRVFTTNLVHLADGHGELDDHQLALVALIGYWAAILGQSQRDKLHQLIIELEQAHHVAPANPVHDVFLSYGRDNTEEMRAVRKLFEDNGLTVWTDEGLRAGTPNWVRAITAAIRGARSLVVMYSAQSVESTWIQREVLGAENYGKRVFVILLYGVEPPLEVMHIQHVRASTIGPVRDVLLPDLLAYLRSPTSTVRHTQVTPPRTRVPAPPPDDGGDISEIFEKGEKAYEAGNYAEAEKHFKRVVARDPNGIWGDDAKTLLKEVERQRKIQQRDKDYARIVARVEREGTTLSRTTRNAWREFSRKYPNHDPQNIGWRVELSQALQRARTFTGKRNTDWKPYITTFSELKIPDMRFCLVPVGSFTMGADDIDDDSRPPHPQTIRKPYWIAETPVTNAQWRVGVEAGAVEAPKGEKSETWYADPKMANAPVVGVSWLMVRDFAAWMGEGVALPSELQWEYAARGVESWAYPWGNTFDGERLVYEKTRVYGDSHPAPVDIMPEGASWVGARHLAGNVWEWTASKWADYPYVADDSLEDASDDVSRRALRGGSWHFGLSNARAAYRDRNLPSFRDFDLGVRFVRVPLLSKLATEGGRA